MATATSAELTRRLGAHGNMLTRQHTLVEAARSVVMDPDDAAIAEIKMRGHMYITDTVFPDDGFTGLVIGRTGK